MDNSELRGLLADLAKDDPRPWTCVLEIRAANFLREHGARLLADSDELAALKARIAAKATEWRERRTHADALDKACGGERFAYTAAGMEWCADELDALLRLPVGEGE